VLLGLHRLLPHLRVRGRQRRIVPALCTASVVRQLLARTRRSPLGQAGTNMLCRVCGALDDVIRRKAAKYIFHSVVRRASSRRHLSRVCRERTVAVWCSSEREVLREGSECARRERVQAGGRDHQGRRGRSAVRVAGVRTETAGHRSVASRERPARRPFGCATGDCGDDRQPHDPSSSPGRREPRGDAGAVQVAAATSRHPAFRGGVSGCSGDGRSRVNPESGGGVVHARMNCTVDLG
jgi:hypothetical protein